MKPLIYVTSDPAGHCSTGATMRWNTNNGTLFVCVDRQWGQVSAGASGFAQQVQQPVIKPPEMIQLDYAEVFVFVAFVTGFVIGLLARRSMK